MRKRINNKLVCIANGNNLTFYNKFPKTITRVGIAFFNSKEHGNSKLTNMFELFK